MAPAGFTAAIAWRDGTQRRTASPPGVLRGAPLQLSIASSEKLSDTSSFTPEPIGPGMARGAADGNQIPCGDCRLFTAACAVKALPGEANADTFTA